MTRSELRARSSRPSFPPLLAPSWGEIPVPEAPADILARGWIAAIGRLCPNSGYAFGAMRAAESWTIETLLKLGFAAPRCAYEVGVRIVELSDDPWILEAVRVAVFEDLWRRGGSEFRVRLSADARRQPRLRRVLDKIITGARSAKPRFAPGW
jgi:hypothetical protein